jgi:hypothetical protein
MNIIIKFIQWNVSSLWMQLSKSFRLKCHKVSDIFYIPWDAKGHEGQCPGVCYNLCGYSTWKHKATNRIRFGLHVYVKCCPYSSPMSYRFLTWKLLRFKCWPAVWMGWVCVWVRLMMASQRTQSFLTVAPSCFVFKLGRCVQHHGTCVQWMSLIELMGICCDDPAEPCGEAVSRIKIRKKCRCLHNWTIKETTTPATRAGFDEDATLLHSSTTAWTVDPLVQFLTNWVLDSVKNTTRDMMLMTSCKPNWKLIIQE